MNICNLKALHFPLSGLPHLNFEIQHSITLDAQHSNAYWDRELKGYLSARGFAFLAGEGRGEIGEWPPESSILAFGMSRAQAASIGRRFRQNAIVYVSLGRPAELVMLRWLG